MKSLECRAPGVASRCKSGVMLLALLSAFGSECRGQDATRLTEQEIEDRVAQTEASGEITAATKTKVLESLGLALVAIRNARSAQSKAEKLRGLATSAPTETERIRAELEEDPIAAPVPGPEVEASELDQLLASVKAEAQAFQTTLTKLEADLASEALRPAKTREELALAKTKLAEIQAEAQAPPTDGESDIVKEARRTLLAWREEFRKLEIQALELEDSSYEARVRLLGAQRDLTSRQLAVKTTQLTSIQGLVSEKQRETAAEAQRKAERDKAAAQNKHESIQSVAAKNASWSESLGRHTTAVAGTIEDRNAAQVTRQRIDEEYQSAKNKFDRFGLSEVLGELLLNQRRKLPDVARYRANAAARETQIAEASIEHFTVSERRRELQDIAAVVEQIRQTSSVEAAQSEAVESELTELLESQKQLLEELDKVLTTYSKALVDLDYDEKQLLAKAGEYADFLDDRLLWTPSAKPLGPKFLADAYSSIPWLTAPATWSNAVSAVLRRLERAPLSTLAPTLLLIALFLARPRILRRVEDYSDRVRKRRYESILLTVGSLALLALALLPIPILLAAIGNILRQTIDASGFAPALGKALLMTAGLLFVLSFMRRLMRRDGVAMSHFGWSDSATSRVRQHLHWFAPIALAATFLTTLAESQSLDAHRSGLGRFAFIIGSAAVFVFTTRVLSTRTGLLSRERTTGQAILARIRAPLYAIAVLAPLSLIVLSGLGYHYTAIRLDARILSTVGVCCVAILVYHTVMRWLVVARIRLALERRRAKRAAAAESSNPETPSDAEGVAIEQAPEIDLATVKEQTVHVVNLVISIGVLLAISFLWADVLSALRALDFVLWESHQTSGGETITTPVTFVSLLLSIAIIALTSIFSRNLPGLLEVAVLQRISMESGVRYAISTIGQYTLIAIGSVLAFNAIGIGWSQVQWLVAALGVGLGFGLQEIFANFVSGLIILIERPIRVGDTVTVGQISGTVAKIRIRATTIVDWDQKELVVPNKTFITGELINWSLSNPVTRLVVRVGIAYGSDTELALKLMMNATKTVPAILSEPEASVYFVGFGDSSLDFEVRVFVKELTNSGRTAVIHALHLRIDKLFRENGVEIPFPQVDLHVKDNPNSQSS